MRRLRLQEVVAVGRLHRQFAALVCAQWVSLIVLVFLLVGGGAGALFRFLCAPVFLVAVVAVPMTGYRLLKRLNVESPGGLAMVMYAPLFSLLTLLGMRTFNQQWSRLRHRGRYPRTDQRSAAAAG